MRTASITTLKRKATDIIAALEDGQDPVLITHRGRPVACLITVEAYEGMKERLSILDGITRGERAVQAGRLIFHAEAKRRMARWLS